MSLENRIQELLDRHFENVKPTGEDNLKAVCPFHDGSASARTFSISLRTGAWICFHSTCGAHGSFIQLMKLLGMTAKQIDRALEDMRPGPDVPSYLKTKAELQRVPVFLPEYILGAWSELPRKLLDAGFSEETLREHEIGVDKERQRIIFPIRDYMGRLAAVSGRAIDPTTHPKYKVYDARKRIGELDGIVEKYVPDNRRHLFGYHTVYPERFFKSEAECPPLVIVEGYKACMWMRQSGFPHTVALQGSSLSVGQRRLLQRLAGPFYILLDHQPGKAYPDKFRRCAAIDIAAVLERTGRTFVCQYPKESPLNTQPDALTSQELQKIIDSAKTTTQLHLDHTT